MYELFYTQTWKFIRYNAACVTHTRVRVLCRSFCLSALLPARSPSSAKTKCKERRKQHTRCQWEPHTHTHAHSEWVSYYIQQTEQAAHTTNFRLNAQSSRIEIKISKETQRKKNRGEFRISSNRNTTYNNAILFRFFIWMALNGKSAILYRLNVTNKFHWKK